MSLTSRMGGAGCLSQSDAFSRYRFTPTIHFPRVFFARACYGSRRIAARFQKRFQFQRSLGSASWVVAERPRNAAVRLARASNTPSRPRVVRPVRRRSDGRRTARKSFHRAQFTSSAWRSAVLVMRAPDCRRERTQELSPCRVQHRFTTHALRNLSGSPRSARCSHDVNKRHGHKRSDTLVPLCLRRVSSGSN